MQKFIKSTGIAAIILLVASTGAGCSAIGYFVGGAIDGGSSRVDSLSVTRTVDSSGVEHSSWDGEHLASLVKEASPRGKSSFEVFTREGAFAGKTLAVDTVLGIMTEPADQAGTGFLRDEVVNVSVQGRNLSQVRGRVLGRTGKTILVWVDRTERRRLPLIASASFRGERGVLGEEATAVAGISGRLVRVPGLVLGEESPPLFFPFADVDRIRVVQSGGWGTARTVGFVTGAVLDVMAIIGSISAASSLGSIGWGGSL